MSMLDDTKLTIEEMMAVAYETAKSKGWHDGPLANRPLETEMLLMISEIAEACEELRNGHAPADIYYVRDKQGNMKPEGVPVEFADAIIRICESSEKRGIPLVRALREKLAYNMTRPVRHGGKAF